MPLLGEPPEEWLSLSLAFVGGYGDAAGFVLAKTFTGHITGNLVLAAVSIASVDWRTTLSRLLAPVLFLCAASCTGVASYWRATGYPLWADFGNRADLIPTSNPSASQDSLDILVHLR
jgi:uncharacterized membrane protein YoaK (UPF0700 family)